MTPRAQMGRRNANGSIDFDFYRSRATKLRRRAMRDVARKERSLAAGLVLICGAAAATLAVLVQ
jgi:hypothetical protein